jgi:hypothetical protein
VRSFLSLLYLHTKLNLSPPHTGTIKHATAAKVAVFTCALDIAQTGEEERLAKVRAFFLTIPPTFSLSFPESSRDRKLTLIQQDNQRNSHLWHQSHHHQLLHQRLSPAAPQHPLHRHPQSPLQIRAPPSLPRRQRDSPGSHGDAHRGGSGGVGGRVRDDRL